MSVFTPERREVYNGTHVKAKKDFQQPQIQIDHYIWNSSYSVGPLTIAKLVIWLHPIVQTQEWCFIFHWDHLTNDAAMLTEQNAVFEAIVERTLQDL